MQKIKVLSFWKIDEVIKMLLNYQAKGESIFVDYRGTLLFSDEIDIDKAYLICTGLTASEFEDPQGYAKKGPDKALADQKRATEDIMLKLGLTYEQSKNYILPNMLENWETFYKRYEYLSNEKPLLIELTILLKELFDGKDINEICTLVNTLQSEFLEFYISAAMRYSKRGNELFDAYYVFRELKNNINVLSDSSEANLKRTLVSKDNNN